jgi:hypothetical protein
MCAQCSCSLVPSVLTPSVGMLLSIAPAAACYRVCVCPSVCLLQLCLVSTVMRMWCQYFTSWSITLTESSADCQQRELPAEVVWQQTG